MDWPTKQYSIIYADPPWMYRNYNYATTKSGSRAKRGVVKEYQTQDVDWIKKLPVASISADDSVLFLWATFPLLPEALTTLTAWGFEYRTVGFNWVKTNKKAETLFWGMGNWTRSNSEVCLIGIKGEPKRVSASVHSVVMSPVGQHSKKPDVVRDRIVQLCGDVSRIELFARQQTDGWDVWGNEIT